MPLSCRLNSMNAASMPYYLVRTLCQSDESLIYVGMLAYRSNELSGNTRFHASCA